MTAACLLVRSPACSARQLQTSIVQVVHLCPTGFRKEPCERLERHKPKGLRVVLRGLGSSNAPRLPGGGGGDVTSLPDTWVGNHPGLPGPGDPLGPTMCTNPGLSSRLCGKPGIVILSPRKTDHRIPVDWVEIPSTPGF